MHSGYVGQYCHGADKKGPRVGEVPGKEREKKHHVLRIGVSSTTIISREEHGNMLVVSGYTTF